MNTAFPSSGASPADHHGRGAALGRLVERSDRACDFVSIGALLDGISRLFASEARRKGVSLHCRVARQLGAAVRIDSLRLRHILANFVGNALMDAESGAIDIDACATTAVDGATGLQFVVSGTATAPARMQRGSIPGGAQPRDDRRPWSICERLAGEMGGSIRLEADGDGRITHTLRLLLPRIAGEQPMSARTSRAHPGDQARRRADRSMAR